MKNLIRAAAAAAALIVSLSVAAGSAQAAGEIHSPAPQSETDGVIW